MAQAGITRWAGRNASGTESGDDVQKSLELLDQVLSEFDDIENGNLTGEEIQAVRYQTLANSLAVRSKLTEASNAPDDDSPSLGHQSEDDGYMSMNGKHSKFVLGFQGTPGEGMCGELPPGPNPPPDPPPMEMADYPPPPEEAERIISNLLPKVSPVNSNKRQKNHACFGKSFLNSITFCKVMEPAEIDSSATTATQTTLPKTRYQRPFGWENNVDQVPLHLQIIPQYKTRCGSLPYEGALHHSKYPPTWLQKTGPLPPRTLACALDRHREVRRQNSDDLSGPKCFTTDNVVEDNTGNFSDDSLEESAPAISKRGSIAWEVPLGFEDEETYLTPGSTKVIGRRRRKSTDHSSNNSINRTKEIGDWPEPPPSADDDSISPYSDSFYGPNDSDDLSLPEALPLDLTFNGTYVIRKGRKKARSHLSKDSSFEAEEGFIPSEDNSSPVKYETESSLEMRSSSKASPTDLKRASSTFDNIKSFLRERFVENLDDLPPEFTPPEPPKLVRVASLPLLPGENPEVTDSLETHYRNSKCERFGKMNELAVTLEEAEEELSSIDNPSLTQELELCSEVADDVKNVCNGVSNKQLTKLESSPKSMKRCNEVQTQTDLSDTEAQNEPALAELDYPEISKTKSELEEVEKKIQEIVKIKTVIEKEEAREESFADPWIRVEEKPPDEIRVNVEVLQHDFGPLPPSPVEEDEEEYANVFQPASAHSSRGQTDSVKEPFYRCQEPPSSDPCGKYLNRPPEPLPHRTSYPVSTCRSVDAGYNRASKGYSNGPRSENTTERRTLPSEFPGPISRRRPVQKKSSTLPQENGVVSCSLPETPIFSRGCDIPRTPHRHPVDSIRPAGLQGSTYRRNGTASNSSNCNTGVSLTGGFNQAMVGAELLRLAGGPGRGWYPRHRQHRPASIEQLDRLQMSGGGSGNGVPGPWDIGASRKPMTLPPNITPKFFHRSPREALRRVTSLLIRGKGSNSKEKKEVVPPASSSSSTRFGGDTAEHQKQKKGFFRNFWKRSRHYSLDRQ